MVTIIKFLIVLFEKLPSDPFVSYLQKLDEILSTYLGYVNWIIPVKEMFIIAGAWAGALVVAKVFMTIYNILIKKVAS